MIRAALILWIGLGLGTIGKAQTFEDGYQSYMRNQFPVAELQFKGALKKAKTKEDMAFVLKFVGICQYMRGDKNQAASSFYQALANDKSLTIDEEEVLDPTVVSFFNFLKAKWAKEPAAAQKPQVAAKGPGATEPLSPASAQTPSTVKPKTSLAARTPPKAARLRKSPESSEENTVVPAGNRKSSSGSSSLSFVHFLPFGAGQFRNKSYLLGTGLALGQVIALYEFVSIGNQITERQGLNEEVRNNDGISDDRKQDFFNQNGSYISGLQKDRNLYLGLFAGLWIGGALDAILRAPSPTPSPARESRTSSGEDAYHSDARVQTAASPSPHFQGTWLPSSRGGTWLVQAQIPTNW